MHGITSRFSSASLSADVRALAGRRDRLDRRDAGGGLSEYVFFSPEQLAKPGFNPASASLSWALSGFSNTTVWLIFGAFMFALGYEKTGLGRRIALMLVKAMGRKTLTLGYAVDDCRHDSRAVYSFEHRAQRRHDLSGDPQLAAALRFEPERPVHARGWAPISCGWRLPPTCVTSSMFLTGLAPNLLAVELVQENGEDRN